MLPALTFPQLQTTRATTDLAIPDRLYATPTRRAASYVRSIPLKRVFFKSALIQAKISSTLFRVR